MYEKRKEPKYLKKNYRVEAAIDLGQHEEPLPTIIFGEWTCDHMQAILL